MVPAVGKLTTGLLTRGQASGLGEIELSLPPASRGLHGLHIELQRTVLTDAASFLQLCNGRHQPQSPRAGKLGEHGPENAEGQVSLKGFLEVAPRAH